ncbi:MAG: 6,7-dimethyl-8-ribityllumazine synthase [Candidatus Cloacimonadota bacterium]|nr:MAG: 6,7-dimethyl-8-ribityllumazine synthase [Candidatus Cloacimonadota bacterium]
MIQASEGNLIAKDLRFGIIISRFNRFISEKLLEGAIDCIKRHDGDEAKIKLFWVPGSFELPLTAKKIAQSGKFDVLICIGALVRGETPHFDYIAQEAVKGIAKASFDTGIPIGFGVVTADSTDQAIERAGLKAGNRGWDAALSVIELANLFKKLS